MFNASGSLASSDGGTAIPASSETRPKMLADDGELSPIKADTRAAHIAGREGCGRRD